MRSLSISAPEMRCKVLLEATMHCHVQCPPHTPGCLPTPLQGPLPCSSLSTAPTHVTHICLPSSGRAWASRGRGFLTWPRHVSSTKDSVQPPVFLAEWIEELFLSAGLILAKKRPASSPSSSCYRHAWPVGLWWPV